MLKPKTMDPLEIQNRFSTEKYPFFNTSEKTFRLEDFREFIDRLPQREIDLIEMYYQDNKKQKEIAEFFGVTQGAISHRLARALKRLKFLRDMPKISQDMQTILGSHFTDFEIDVITYMIETTCQSKTADLLNKKYKLRGRDRMTQVKIRHKYDRFITKLKKMRRRDAEIKMCHDLMVYVKNNLYMMHEVILPHFCRGFKVKYDKVF